MIELVKKGAASVGSSIQGRGWDDGLRAFLKGHVSQ
jgi:hypothetical protein